MNRFMEPEEYEAYLKEQAEAEKAILEHVAMEQPEGQSEVQVSLYEMNQNIIGAMPNMTAEQLMFARETFKDWVEHNRDTYYMLLCNELHYYTIFRFPYTVPHVSNARYETFWNELMDVMSYVGPIKVIEEDTNGMIAIWAHSEQDGLTHCWYMFPYGKGVVEV